MDLESEIKKKDYTWGLIERPCLTVYTWDFKCKGLV